MARGSRTTSKGNDPAAQPQGLLRVIGAPLDGEDDPPTPANITSLSGPVDTMILEFFFVHPHKIGRFLASTDPVKEGIGKRVADQIRFESPPVAKVALPLTVALELGINLIQNAMMGMPLLLQQIQGMGERAGQMQMLGELMQKNMEELASGQPKTHGETPDA